MDSTFPGYKEIPVRTWFLVFEGTLPDVSSFEPARLEHWKNPEVDEYLELYREVGDAWGWSGRLLKTRNELEAILNSASNEVWLFKVEDEVTGFFEITRQEKEAEIVYLGLKPDWIGKRLGQKLIKAAIAKAGQNGEKVWLHTCERDHASALAAYQKAGFSMVKETVSMEYYPE